MLNCIDKLLPMKKIPLIYVLVVLTIHFAGAQEPVQKTSIAVEKYTFENCINSLDTAKAVKTAVGYQYWFIPREFLADGLTVKMSVVGPDQATHAPHKHPGDEIFFVLEGTARFYLNGQSTTGSAYSTFYCPEDSEHGISNDGNTTLKYLVIRKYPVN